MTFTSAPVSSIPSSSFCKIIVKGAKNTEKYRREALRKNSSTYVRRFRDSDIEQFSKLCEEHNINWGYDPSCDDIWFETKVLGKDMILQGYNTGGQFLRLLLQLAIKSGEGVTKPLNKLELKPFTQKDRFMVTKKGKTIRKNGKSCTSSGSQARMWILRKGDSFECIGGDDQNTDALPLSQQEDVYKLLKETLGYVFTLERISKDDNEVSHFKVHREENIEPSLDTVNTNIYHTDQILMGILGGLTSEEINSRIISEENISLGRKLTIICPKSDSFDYHVDALMYLLKEFKFNTLDTKPLGNQNELDEWYKSSDQRTLTIW